MKLYYAKGACSFAVRIVIHEINIPCEFISVDLKAKKTASGADYLKINPKGAVPVLELDNGEILTENAVIQQYLADEYKTYELLPAVGTFQRYHVLEWLNYVSSDLHKAFGPLFNPSLPEDAKPFFKELIKKKLQVVDEQLQKNKFLTGDVFTLSDTYLFVICRWLKNVDLDINTWPALSRYFEELKKRPAIMQSLKEEGITA